MTSVLKRKLVVLFAFVPHLMFSQLCTSNGATIYISFGGYFTSNGGVTLTNGSTFTNEGNLLITKNSSLSLPGTYTIETASVVNGNGAYSIEQDWINDATFNSDNSAVNLFGDTEQFITSTNGTITEFNTLILSGNGTGNNRKKTLQGVDARISTDGLLSLNGRELSTLTNNMIVLNPDNTSITNYQVFGTEGFVSSDSPGYLNWTTNSANDYVFPLGSSNGTTRYRPVVIHPADNGLNIYNARLNNESGDNYGFLLSQHDDDIEVLNSLYFHSIEQASGNSDADLSISYEPNSDGNWIGIGHWMNSSNLWNSVGNTSASSLGNYNLIEKSGWDFPDPDHPYILINLTEELIIPNVFTPNQDGANDLFGISGKNLTEFNLVIVNRWGNVVFESNDINISWDGTSNGLLCDDGVYFYILNAKSNSNEYKKHGHLTLNAQ